MSIHMNFTKVMGTQQMKKQISVWNALDRQKVWAKEMAKYLFLEVLWTGENIQ